MYVPKIVMWFWWPCCRDLLKQRYQLFQLAYSLWPYELIFVFSLAFLCLFPLGRIFGSVIMVWILHLEIYVYFYMYGKFMTFYFLWYGFFVFRLYVKSNMNSISKGERCRYRWRIERTSPCTYCMRWHF